MATKLTFRDVEKKYESWNEANTRNWDRGKACETFAIGEQWDPEVVSRRAADSKESLVLNASGTKLATEKANFKEIELTLDLTPNSNNTDPSADEKQEVYRAIMQHITINNESRDAFSRASDKLLDFGSAVVKVSYAFENQKSLNKGITIGCVENVSSCFFDADAKLPTRVDGAYCGILKSGIDLEDLPIEYQSKAKKNNTLIDYWYRSFKKAKFALLETGEYKRIDLIDEQFDQVAEDQDGSPTIKMRSVPSIMYCRFLNEEKVESQQWPVDDMLPLVYWYGKTKTIDDELFTEPFIFKLMDVQKLLNYNLSTLASSYRSAASGKSLLVSKEHVMTKAAAESAKSYSTNSGVHVFDSVPGIAGPQPLPQYQIPAGLDGMTQNCLSLIDNISGVQLSQMGAKDNAISGVAIDARVRQSEVINNNVMDAHVQCINTVALIIQQMIPKVYTEQRALVIKNVGGQAQVLSINQPQPTTGTKLNDISLMANKYMYTISAGPSTALQKQNAIADLTALGQGTPQLAPFIAIATLEAMNLNNKDGLIQIIKSQLDPLQLQLYEGDMSLQEFSQAQQQQQQQQAQQEQQQQQQQPQEIPIDFQMQMQQEQQAVKQQEADTGSKNAETEALKAGIQQQETNLKVQMAPHNLAIKESEAVNERQRTQSEERQNQRDNIAKVSISHMEHANDAQEEDII